MSRFLLIILLLLSVGCTTPLKRQNAQIAKLVYSQRVALAAGRIDRVKQFNTELTRLVPKPKVIVKVPKFTARPLNKDGIRATEQTFLVLPPELGGLDTLVENSDKYKELLMTNPSLKKEEDKSNKEITKLEEATDSIIRDKEAVVQKAGEKSHWLAWLTGGVGLMSALGIGGILLLLIFFPAALPLVMSIVGRFFSAIISVGNKLLGWVSHQWTK